MKFYKYIFCMFITLFVCSGLYAEVSDEIYQKVLDRLKLVEDSVKGLNDYIVKVDNIENDFNNLSSNIKKLETSGINQSGFDNNYNSLVDTKIKDLEETVNGLQDRAHLIDITEEIRRVQEFVCKNGHVYSSDSGDGKCPLDGLKLKNRNRYKLYKFARRESISERISSAVEEEFENRIVIGASGTGVFQQVVNSDREEKSFAEGSFDLFFISEPLLHTTFLIDLEAIGGNGPDEIIASMSGLNDDSGSLQDDDGVDRLSVREVWLQTLLFKERLKLVGGKIDLTNYFDSNTVANDETTQFLSSAFVNNPTMEAPENGPGMVAFFDTRKGLTFGFGLQNDDNSGFDITNQLYAIAEIGYRAHLFFGQEGNYRLWGKVNGGQDDNKGFGISIDQNISTRFAAFARYGANEADSGDSDIASAWSAGVRLRSPFFSRVNDEIGFAFGSLDIVGGDDESITESYYKLQINEHFAITPNFQAVFDPVGVGKDETVALVGIRTQIEF